MLSVEELLSPNPSFIGLVAQTPRDSAPSPESAGFGLRCKVVPT